MESQAEFLRHELGTVLQILEDLQRHQKETPDRNNETNSKLNNLKRELEEERDKNVRLSADYSSLEQLSSDLQKDVLGLDESRLALRSSREEVSVLEKVLQKISRDHEELQARYDKMMQVKINGGREI